MSKRNLLALAAAAIGLGHAGLAVADYNTSYTVTLNPDNTAGQPVTNILMAEENDYQGSLTWPFQADGNSSTVLVNPFSTPQPITRSLLIGLVHDLPNDAPGQYHVVLMLDPLAAQLSENIAWGTLFRTTLEDQLVADIQLATSGQDFSVILPGLDGVSNFLNGDARTGILDPQGQSVSAYFATGGAFTIESWSDGTILGTGVSQVVVVPEPMNMGLVGVALLALGRRRRAQ